MHSNKKLDSLTIILAFVCEVFCFCCKDKLQVTILLLEKLAQIHNELLISCRFQLGLCDCADNIQSDRQSWGYSIKDFEIIKYLQQLGHITWYEMSWTKSWLFHFSEVVCWIAVEDHTANWDQGIFSLGPNLWERDGYWSYKQSKA